MPGTVAGGLKANKTIIKRFGKKFLSKRGQKGGQAKNPNKGFGSNKELASQMGKINSKKRWL